MWTGGDVFKFAGDAIIVFWLINPKEDTPETIVRRCIQCALRIQQHLHQATFARDVVLSIKMGIGVGRATIAHLGGVSDGATSRMEYVGVGPALIQAFGAEHHASPGDVICSAECWALVSSSFAGVPILEHGHAATDGCVRVTEVLHPVRCQSRRASFTRDDITLQKRMQQYVSRAVWPYLDDAEEFWGSELREVTVLFINLGFADADLSKMLDVASVHKLHAAFAAVQKCIYDYEGTINKFLVDDKGSTAIAVFGMPPVTHENDPIRGILASLAICAALTPLGLKASVGITSGTAFCGVVGHQGNRREYTVLGDIVNLAARLMQRAKSEHGGVITDESTKLSTEDVLHFEERPQIMVKGKHDSIKIHRPYPRMSNVIKHHLEKPTNTPRTINVMENMHSMQVTAAKRRLSAKLARLATDASPSDDDDGHPSSTSVPENAGALDIQAALRAKLELVNPLHSTGAFLLEGDIGVGKTRLIRSTLRSPKEVGAPEHPQQPSPRVVFATATPFTPGKDYVVFADVLVKLCPPSQAVGPTIAAWVAQGVAPQTHLLDHLHVLNDVLDGVEFDKPLSNQDSDSAVSGAAMAAWFVDLLATDLMENQSGDSSRASDARESLWCPSDLDVAGMLLLSALYAVTRDHPVVLCIDNAMYMDEKSWILTISVAKYFSNCLVVVVSRPPSVAVTQRTASCAFRKKLRALKELPSTTSCHMGRMTPVQIEMLATRILNIPTLPTELANLLVSRSQGNPLFLHELIKVMKDQGVLWVDEKTQLCETRVQVAWADKASAVACFGCQVKLPPKTTDRNRCKACGYVFCAPCTPKQCFKVLAGQGEPMRHCKGCFGMTRGRRPSFERSASDSRCLAPHPSSSSSSTLLHHHCQTSGNAGAAIAAADGKKPMHRKALSMFVHPSDPSTPLKHRMALVAPPTIKSVLTTLLDQLTVSQYMLMKTASVIGSSFDLDTVRAVYPIKGHYVKPAKQPPTDGDPPSTNVPDKNVLPVDRFMVDIHALERLSMIQPVDVFIGGLKVPSQTTKFEFCHGFMQDVIRSQMLSAQCDKLATRLADCREQKAKAMRQQFFAKAQGSLTPLSAPPSSLPQTNTHTPPVRCHSTPHVAPPPPFGPAPARTSAGDLHITRSLSTVLKLKAGMVHVKKHGGVLSHFRLGSAAMWKRRWAVLHNTRLLLQYDNHRGGGRSTSMELNHARVSTCDMTHDPAGVKYHCLQLDVQEWCRMQPQATPESLSPRVFILGLESARELDYWIYMLKYAIESLKEG
ncbi:hypothetical protein, variant 1 [Aphanomyces astaci]|uniref:Guanylate cyclase domain-containing protein n=1 Tax=Aphanomyces astaci TaxID=112090 RepID=W4H697_APHAT|nr:hypothetical protein, variant 1 [Aphanomyces astaci]ETV87086.1 hypothetical protein, variant 1 [Aphanomyces astaci]|eukprot:XP_009823886.1 hypothetical protein, variant 1 [Aphanomyces astaci]